MFDFRMVMLRGFRPGPDWSSLTFLQPVAVIQPLMAASTALPLRLAKIRCGYRLLHRAFAVVRPAALLLVCTGKHLRHPSDVNGSPEACNEPHGQAPDHIETLTGSGSSARAVALLKEAIELLSIERPAQLREQALIARPDRLMRLPEVMQLTGLRRSAVYEQMQRGTFPRSVEIGPRAATWSEAAVRVWIARCLEGR